MLLASRPAPSQAQDKVPLLVVRGDVASPLQISDADWKQFPRTKVSAKDHDGIVRTYEGVALLEILHKAGVPTGHDLRGKQMTLCIIADASDGYHAIFSLTELDPDFAGEQVLVADTADGKALPEAQGRLRLVVPGDKRQGRWVRLLTGLTVKNIPQ